MTRLRRSDPSKPGYSRRRSGRGFSYRDPSGATVRDPEELARFRALAIPPAWTDVWIAPHVNGHIQAIGVDAALRRQYIYHPAWRERKDRAKFERALELAHTLPAARAHVTRELRGRGAPRDRALAAAFRMLDTASLRVGSERYTNAHGSHGLSTLLCSHVSVRGDTVTLCFPAKSGQVFRSELTDPDLAAFLRRRLKGRRDAALFSWKEHGLEQTLTASDINEFIRERTGGDFTAKDFRTLSGTVAAALSLAASRAEGAAGSAAPVHGTDGAKPAASGRAHKRAISRAMQDAALVLGNTPAIARRSYVDPRVVDLYLAGETLDPAQRVTPESGLRALLRRDG